MRTYGIVIWPGKLRRKKGKDSSLRVIAAAALDW